MNHHRESSDCGIDRRRSHLVGYGSLWFDTTGCREDHLGLAVLNPLGQLLWGKPSKDHRVNRTKTRTGQHRHEGLRDHGHVDDHRVALVHPMVPQDPRNPGHQFSQLRVGDLPRRLGNRTVVINGDLGSMTRFHMPVNRVVADIQGSANKPAIKRRVGAVQDLPTPIGGRIFASEKRRRWKGPPNSKVTLTEQKWCGGWRLDC